MQSFNEGLSGGPEWNLAAFFMHDFLMDLAAYLFILRRSGGYK